VSADRDEARNPQRFIHVTVRHNNMKVLSTFILFSFILISCCFNNEDEKRLESLYRQRIENSNYVFYDFFYSGPFVSSSNFYGITILDSSETFLKSKIDPLPGSYFITKPMIDNFRILVIDNEGIPITEKDTLLTPIGEYSKKFNDVMFKITKYNETYGSNSFYTGLMCYEFDSLKETKDSLIFYNVTKKTGGKIFPQITSFLKGNIKVIDSNDNKIIFIQIEQAIIQRGEIYKPSSPFKLIPNQPIVGIASYLFYPRKTIYSSILSDYGIWKRIK
jgi:hypothetical protein